ncbi:MAG: hypothetical protein ACYC69_15070 [Thermodesulfovibrionales bacterium]
MLTVNSHVRSLAEAVILQSIEDLWDPACKKGSLLFFEGDGFVLYCQIAGISYTKRCSMIRMFAAAGPASNLRSRRKVL